MRTRRGQRRWRSETPWTDRVRPVFRQEVCGGLARRSEAHPPRRGARQGPAAELDRYGDDGGGPGRHAVDAREVAGALLGQGLHRPALVEHRVGGPAAARAGEDRQQLGVAQRADAVPLEAFPGDEARGARVGSGAPKSCAAALLREGAPPPPPCRPRPGLRRGARPLALLAGEPPRDRFPARVAGLPLNGASQRRPRGSSPRPPAARRRPAPRWPGRALSSRRR